MMYNEVGQFVSQRTSQISSASAVRARPDQSPTIAASLMRIVAQDVNDTLGDPE